MSNAPSFLFQPSGSRCKRHPATGLLWLACALMALELGAAWDLDDTMDSRGRRLAQNGGGAAQLSLALQEAGVTTDPFPFGVTVTPTEAFSPQRAFIFPFACPPTKGDTVTVNQPQAGEVPSPTDEFPEGTAEFPGGYSVITRDRGEAFVLGGINLQTGNATRPYLSKINTNTMQQIWRSYLQDERLAWQATGAMALDSNRNVIASFGNRIVRVDGSDGNNGMIMNNQTFNISINGSLPENTGHTGFAMMSDGNIVTKSIHKSPSCNITRRGSSLRCVDLTVNGSLTVLNGSDLSILYNLPTLEASSARMTSSVSQGRQYVYYVGITGTVYRYLYNGTAENKIALDSSWRGKAKGMPDPNGNITAFGTAATPLNEWVVVGSNGLPSNGSYALTAIWQADAHISHSIVAFPDAKGESWGPTSVAADPVSNLVFANDFLACRIGAFRLTAGGWERVWEQEQCTTDFISVIGPADSRVLVATNMTEIFTIKPNFTKLLNAEYQKEVLIFRAAETGEAIMQTPEVGISAVMPHAPGYDGDYFVLSIVAPFNLTRFSYDTHGCKSEPVWTASS